MPPAGHGDPGHRLHLHPHQQPRCRRKRLGLVGGDGGGIDNNGAVTLTGSTLSGNHAGDRGGGRYDNGGTVTFTSSFVQGNTALQAGGIVTATPITATTPTNCIGSPSPVPGCGG
jgi:hypothetical protein